MQPSLNYVATEECILLLLSRSDFMKVVAETPALLGEMRKNLRERLSMAHQMTKDELVEKLKEEGKLFV
jgi:CRP-like cAMP-binding protein